MTDFLDLSVTGVVTNGPTVQSTGKKYVLVFVSGVGSFKCIAVDAKFTGVIVGDKVTCNGKFRLNQTASGITAVVDSTANPPYTGLNLYKNPGAGDIVVLNSATGKVTHAYAVFDATHKYYKMEVDTDPGEPKITLKIVHSNDYAASLVAAGTQPTLNNQFTNGAQAPVTKNSPQEYQAAW